MRPAKQANALLTLLKRERTKVSLSQAGKGVAIMIAAPFLLTAERL